METKYNLEDKGINGWEFNLDFSEWNNEIITQWICVLDDDFGTTAVSQILLVIFIIRPKYTVFYVLNLCVVGNCCDMLAS